MAHHIRFTYSKGEYTSLTRQDYWLGGTNRFIGLSIIVLFGWLGCKLFLRDGGLNWAFALIAALLTGTMLLAPFRRARRNIKRFPGLLAQIELTLDESGFRVNVRGAGEALIPWSELVKVSSTKDLLILKSRTGPKQTYSKKHFSSEAQEYIARHVGKQSNMAETENEVSSAKYTVNFRYTEEEYKNLVWKNYMLGWKDKIFVILILLLIVWGGYRLHTFIGHINWAFICFSLFLICILVFAPMYHSRRFLKLHPLLLEGTFAFDENGFSSKGKDGSSLFLPWGLFSKIRKKRGLLILNLRRGGRFVYWAKYFPSEVFTFIEKMIQEHKAKH